MSIEPTPSGEKYETLYNNIKANVTGPTCPSCSELRDLRLEKVALEHLKDTYWPVPCLRGWPCLFTQNRTEIQKKIELLEPLEKDLEIRCTAEVEAAIKAKNVHEMLEKIGAK